MTAHWLGIVSRGHVVRGVEAGFAQVCHGKRGPLARMKAGDGLVYYSPADNMGEKARLRAFTAIGTLKDDRIYTVEMAMGFIPHRRDVAYVEKAIAVPLEELKASLELTQSPNWGLALRRGLVPLSARDFSTIARAMGASALAS